MYEKIVILAEEGEKKTSEQNYENTVKMVNEQLNGQPPINSIHLETLGSDRSDPEVTI